MTTTEPICGAWLRRLATPALTASKAGVLALALTHAAFAADQSYVATGRLLPMDEGGIVGYMEVWGFGDDPAYALPATDPGMPFAPLIAGSMSASLNALLPFSHATAYFGYDPLAAPTSSGPGLVNYYPAQPLTVTMGDGSTTAFLGLDGTSLRIAVSTGRHTQNLAFRRTQSTVEGAVPGIDFGYTSAPQLPIPVDLVSLLGPSAFQDPPFLGLDSFTTLPVHLTAPTSYFLAGLTVQLIQNSPTASFTPTPPPALSDLATYNRIHFIYTFIDGVYGVTVDPADFTDPAQYVAARDWVQANIRQINFEASQTFQIETLEPVPEPATWLLLTAGLALLQTNRSAHRQGLNRRRRPA